MRRLLPAAIAALMLTAGCASEPESFDELRAAGKRAYVRQEFGQARAYLGKAVSKQPSDRETLYFLGLAYDQEKMYDSALYYMRRVDILFPDDRGTNVELYRIARQAGDAQIARNAIRVLIKTGDPASLYYRDLAQLSIQLEEYHLAHSFYRLLLAEHPEDPQSYLTASNAAAQIDSLGVALAIIDSAITRFGPRPELRVNKALYLVAADRYAEGEEMLRAVVASDPNNVGYKLNLAHTLGLQEDPVKLREAYRLYEEIKPRVGQEFAIDSLLTVLAEQLGESR